MNSTQRILVILAIVCSFCFIMTFGLVTVAAAQEDGGEPTPTENATANPIDTSKTEYSVAHVTIHDIRWFDNRVEIDITAGRGDTIRVTDFNDDRFYWADYDVERGETTTISHKYRGDSGEVSFAVESAKEGINLDESKGFVSPSTGTFVALLIGLAVAFLLIVELARRDGRLDKYRVEEA